MTIYVDLSAAVHRRAGLGRYAESLTRALEPRVPGRLGVFYNRERGVEPPAGLEHLPSRTVALSYKSWRMLVWLGQLASGGFDRLLPGAELFHATEHLLLPLRGIPTVLTVHDLIFEHLPEHHKPLNRWYLRLAMPLYCRRATRIVAVSCQTRRDLVERYRIPADKITVVMEAAAPHFRPSAAEALASVRSRYGLPERYLLYVGTIEARKNLTRLLQAWEGLYRAGAAPPLVIAGKRGWLDEDFFAALHASTERDGVVLTGYVRDEDLPALYTAAETLVLPSLYEGFGLPILEAMSCGTPVACSNTSSLPEVAGDAAVFFEPADTQAIAAALEHVLSRPALRAELSERGLKRAAAFSWETTARETLAVYDAAVASFRSTRP